MPSGSSPTHKTHRNLNAVVALELGDVLVTAGQLGAVERPEATHHLDARLGCCVPHVGGRWGCSGALTVRDGSNRSLKTEGEAAPPDRRTGVSQSSRGGKIK